MKKKKKYRLKLSNNRIIGPFILEQIGELYIKGHVEESQLCQYFPSGDWLPIEDFPEVSDLILDIISKKITLESLQGNIKARSNSETLHQVSLSGKGKKEEEERENSGQEKVINELDGVSKANEGSISVDYELLEKKYKEKVSDLETEKKDEDEDEDKDRDGDESELDKTVVNIKLSKMPIQNSSEENEDKDEDKDKEGSSDDDKKRAQENREKEKEKALEARTQLVNFNKEKIRRVLKKADDNEKEIKEQILQEQEQKRKEDEEVDELEKNTIHPKEKKTSSKMILICLLAFIALLMSDDDEIDEEFRPLYAELSFPVQEEEDIERSEFFFKQGLEKYRKRDYKNRALAADDFKESVEFNVKNQKAMGYLIMSYAELLSSTQDKRKNSYTIFKLIQINRNKLLTDINVAIGSAIFYKQIKKFKTAQNSIENYLRIGRPSLKLLSYYLMILIQQGNLEQGRKVFEKIKSAKEKVLESYLAMAKFYELNQQFDLGKKVLEEGGKKFKNSVPLLLEYAKYVLEEQNFKKLDPILKVVEKLQAESSPLYYAKYLEYKGIFMASQGKNKMATRFFQEALKINESDELRSKLAALELGGDQAIEKLILESKVVDLMRLASESRRKRAWEAAFRFAIDAVDLLPTYIPAQLLLAQIQIERGYFDSSLKTLKELHKLHPLNKKINFLLLRAYTRAHQLERVREHIVSLSNSKFSRTAEYASALAQYYVKVRKFLLAMKWFQTAIRRNPLNDNYYFLFAKILLKHRKYDKSKLMLTKAIDLDPENVYYRAEYARVLYELDSVETAIGYLRDILENHPEDPKILGEIAIYYYRSGQVENFEKYKAKVQNLLVKDIDFYEFLIRAATLEGDIDKAIMIF